jgi:hypothetical protein
VKKYLIVEPKVKGIAANIALMKWSRYCEIQGYEYQYVRGCVNPENNFEPDKILMSCIFSYYSKKHEKTIDHYLKLFPAADITVGGVFPSINPKWFEKEKWKNKVKIWKGLHPKIDKFIPKYDVVIKSEGKLPYKQDKIVLYASRGCTNKCGYCAVPKLEGGLKCAKSIKTILETALEEIPDAKSVVLYDNSFSSHIYFKKIVNELFEFALPVDIHGLHVNSFTREKAKLLSKLTWGAQGNNGSAYIRFSFDKFKYAKNIKRALKYCVEENIRATFFCYVLYNWIDKPSDVWRKIEICQSIVDTIGEPMQLFFQRYEPLTSLERHAHIGKHWNKDLLQGFARLYTHSKGFISIARSRKMYNWIGHSEKEFLERIDGIKHNIEKKVIVRNDDNMKIKFHPVANIFPLMQEGEFLELKADIKNNGLLEAIWLYDGQVVDGRNRLLACNELGIKPKFRTWKSNGNGQGLVDFVISLNLKRRMLTQSQRAFVACDALQYYEQEAKARKLSNLKKGDKFPDRAKLRQRENGKAVDLCGKSFNVSGRYIQTAKKIIKNYPQIAEQIRLGKRNITQNIFNNDEHREDDKTKILKSIYSTLKQLNIDKLERIMKYIQKI